MKYIVYTLDTSSISMFTIATTGRNSYLISLTRKLTLRAITFPPGHIVGSGKDGTESQLDWPKVHVVSIILEKLCNSTLHINRNIDARHCNRKYIEKRPKRKMLFLPSYWYQGRQLRNTRYEYNVIKPTVRNTLELIKIMTQPRKAVI